MSVVSGGGGGGDAVGHGSSGPPEGGSGAAGHGSQMPFLPTGGLGGVHAGPWGWGLVGGGGVRAPMAWPASTGHFQAPTAWPSAIGTGQPAAAASLKGFSYLPHPAMYCGQPAPFAMYGQPAPFAMYGGQFMPGPPPYGIQQAMPRGPFLINNHFGSSASWFPVHPLHHWTRSIPQGASCYGPSQSLLREASDKPLPDTEGLVASNNGIGNGPQCNSSSARVPTPLGDCGCVSSSPGYRKRTRLPKGVIPPDCRQPRKKMEPTEGGGGRKKPKGAAAPPAMASIGDDVLGDIFLRLPDTATLARAALACKRWRRVASDPALLRRFHSLHGPPPLLGFIMSGPPPRAFAVEGPDLWFLPAPSRNPHLNAAAAAADIHFEDFAAKNPRSGSVIDEWLLRGYDGGRLLLSYGFIEYEQLAVYDPIGRTTDLVCRPDIMQFDFEFVTVHYALLVDEADASFQVVGAQFWNGLIRAAIFSSRTGEWAPLPSLRAPEPWRMRGGMRAGRFAYWQSNTRLERCFYSDELERSLVLDTTTMEWTLIQVPFPAKESYCVTDMAEHGGLCLVSSKDQFVQLWVRDNNSGWVIKKQVSLLKQFGLLKKLRHDEWMKRVRILAVRDGYVYMEFWSIRKPNSYLLVLNWETMKLSVFANDTTDKYRGPAFPFFMTWAPPLLSPAEQQRLCLQGHD